MKDIFHITVRNIETRSHCFRNLIIGIVLIIFISFISSLILKSWHALSSLVFLIPLCGLYLAHDIYLVSKWQREIMKRWCSNELNVCIYIKAINSMRNLPHRTLAGMFESLLVKDHELEVADKLPVYRPMISMLIARVTKNQLLTTILVTIALTLFFICIMLAVTLHSAIALSGLIIPCFIWLASKKLPEWSAISCAKEMNSRFDPNEIKKCVETFSFWQINPVLQGIRMQLISSRKDADSTEHKQKQA